VDLGQIHAAGDTIDPDQPAVFQLSGGTTGIPKIIPRTHNDYIFNSVGCSAANDMREGDCLLVCLPIGHNFPLASPGIQGMFIRGGRVVLAGSPRASIVFPLIERERVTHLELVPAILIRLLHDESLGKYNLSSVRIVNTGGQRLQPETSALVEKLIPSCTAQEVFGMAEGLLNYTRLDDPVEVLENTQGRPLCAADELRIVDGAGEPVGPGEEGELLVRGPYTLNGYFRAERDNERSFDPDGFYRSGDLIRRRDDGNLVVTGRVKDVICRAGETIAAQDLEERMLTHPSIFSAAAVPLPDPYLGEKICAAIVFTGPPISLAELNTHLDERGVAAHARPDMLVAMATLPSTPIGKIDKKAIIRQLSSAS